MKLLIIAPFLPVPENQGLRIELAHLLRTLRDEDTFLVAFKEKEESIPLPELQRLSRHFWVFPRPTISRQDYVKNHFSWKPLLVSRFFTPEAASQIAKITKDEKIDYVFLESLLVAEYIRYVQGAETIFHAYNIESIRAWRRARQTSSPLKKVYYYLIAWRLHHYEIRILRKFDYLLACSEEDKLSLEKICPNKEIIIFPNVVDTDYFALASGKRNIFRLIYIGTLWYEPNEDAVFFLLKEIFPRLKSSFPQIELEIIGEGASRRLVALAQQWGEAVKIRGLVKDIRPFLAEAGALVVPLRSGSGTRIKILTALSMGLPVISTRLGCEGIKVEENKEILLAETAADFEEKIKALLTRPELSATLAANGRALVEKCYSLSSLQSRMDFFLNILKSRNISSRHA